MCVIREPKYGFPCMSDLDNVGRTLSLPFVYMCESWIRPYELGRCGLRVSTHIYSFTGTSIKPTKRTENILRSTYIRRRFPVSVLFGCVRVVTVEYNRILKVGHVFLYFFFFMSVTFSPFH